MYFLVLGNQMDLFTNVLAFRMDKSSLVVWSVFALTMLFLRHLLLDIDLIMCRYLKVDLFFWRRIIRVCLSLRLLNVVN